jgi:hypothetical protein
MLLSQTQTSSWPDGIDLSAVALYLGIAVGLPALGYFFMVLDYRAYLRSFRRALVVIHQAMPGIPAWARRDTPACLIALGLSLPASREQILSAYRQRVKLLHPDRGGDREKFLRLQRHFEAAMEFIDENEQE